MLIITSSFYNKEAKITNGDVKYAPVLPKVQLVRINQLII